MSEPLTMTVEQWLGALADAWDAGANAAVELHNTGTRMTLRARIPFPADENPYRVTPPTSDGAR